MYGYTSFILLIVFWVGISCTKTEENLEIQNKASINGVNFVGSRNEVGSEAFTPLQSINSKWVALVPFGFINEESTEVHYNVEWQWWGEKTEGIVQNAKDVRATNQKIMLKPQIWIRHGSFTGDFSPENEVDWLLFEKTYKAYILHFAEIAEQINAEIFCIGTEFKSFILNRPYFWDELITDTRDIYTGKLIYAANWDAYHLIPFWDKLDYIGVNAYFPLTNEKTPDVNILKKAWNPHKEALSNIAAQTNKSVIFTEYGYASRDYTTEKPWESWRGKTANMQAQENAYIAIFETFWDADWFKGGFLWKWYAHHNDAGGTEHAGYTPQNKPAQEIINEHYLESDRSFE